MCPVYFVFEPGCRDSYLILYALCPRVGRHSLARVGGRAVRVVLYNDHVAYI